MIKPLTPQFRSEILESLNNSYVAMQKIVINQLKNLFKSLPDGYPVPVERRNGR